MQINNLNFVSGSEKWTIVGPQPYESDQSGQTAADPMAAQASQVIEGVGEQGNAETPKTSTEAEKRDKVDKDGRNGQGNQSFDNDNIGLSFKKHEETGEMMVQVIDKNTGQIIREIPPRKILDALAIIWKNAGICVDKKA
jgi:Uncharacterized flagellar protein FlaG